VKNERALLLGRFQPPHLQHYEIIKLTDARPVVFTYALNGEEVLAKDLPFSFKEISRMFESMGVKAYRLEIELEKIKSNPLGMVYSKRKEILSFGNRVVTRDYSELFPMIVLGLNPVYYPLGQKVIRGSKIRKLLYEGKIEEASLYLPKKARKVFKDIVRNKNFKELERRGNLKILNFKLPLIYI